MHNYADGYFGGLDTGEGKNFSWLQHCNQTSAALFLLNTPGRGEEAKYMEPEMSPEDKRAQKAELLLQCHEAEEDLSHAQEKGKQTLEHLEDVLVWLKREIRFEGVYGKQINISDKKYLEVVNTENLRRVVLDITGAQARVKDLRERKNNLRI